MSRALRQREEQQRQQADMDAAREKLLDLSPRAKDVLEHLLQGKSNKEAAKALGVNPRTIEIHRKNVSTKTQTANLVELAQLHHLANAAPHG